MRPGTSVLAGEGEIANPDPVTGESMDTDWKFSLGFKLKLGDAPAEETGEEESSGD
jgi:hypothetical protein